MGSNPGATLSASEARHLVRRTGFGADEKTVKAILHSHGTRGAAANYLLKFKPAKFKPKGTGDNTQALCDIHNSWIRYMLTVKHPLQEKLVLFWHDHFATGFDKVKNATLMAKQNLLFRQNCKGNFKDLVKAANKDTAMMIFLDTAQNRKRQPNENYARELQELFTLGVTDLAGNPNYTQDDIVQIARGFTGWTVHNDTGAVSFNSSQHDYIKDFKDRGAKVIYKSMGGFGATGYDFTQPAGEGALEIDQVIDGIFEHRDTDGKRTVARYIAGKLLTYFSQPGLKRPVDPALAPVIDTVVAESQFDTKWIISDLLRAIFVNDAFYDTAAPAPFGATTKKSVKWPVDYVVGTLRLLGMKLKGVDQKIDFHPEKDSWIITYLNAMGQIVFVPPSVFGWDWDTAWLSSTTLLARYNFAIDVVSARGTGSTSFRPDKMIKGILKLSDAGAIVDAVTDALGATDQFTSAERDAFINYLSDGTPGAAIDLRDKTVRNTKLNGLFALVLQSPAYQLH
jgi:uncharacterized protein (DUF1800 family)